MPDYTIANNSKLSVIAMQIVCNQLAGRIENRIYEVL